MEKTLIAKSEIKLLGLRVRTSYRDELDPIQGHVFPCVRKYFYQSLFDKIPNRTNPGTTFCAYTEYESDHKGAYTYFIGEEISSYDFPLSEDLQLLIIPPQNYVKFSTKSDPMSNIIADAWKKIWNMSSADLGGKRSFKTDFEIYDERSSNKNKIALDIYIGID